jgi:hypothetical protein
MTTKLSLEYLTKTLRLCWNATQLEEAAKLWPANPTWAWFLGARLVEMARAAVMERVHVALAHVHHIRLQAPQRPSVMLAWFRAASDEQLIEGAQVLGKWLDEPSNSELRAQLAAVFEPPAIIEAKPPATEPAAPPAAETNETPAADPPPIE